MKLLRHAFALLVFALADQTLAQAQDPLPSWNDGPAKQAILAFVKEVTDKSDPKYVAPEDRIATFDQDGTLWVEHPMGPFEDSRRHANRHVGGRVQRRSKEVARDRQRSALGPALH